MNVQKQAKKRPRNSHENSVHQGWLQPRRFEESPGGSLREVQPLRKTGTTNKRIKLDVPPQLPTLAQATLSTPCPFPKSHLEKLSVNEKLLAGISLSLFGGQMNGIATARTRSQAKQQLQNRLTIDPRTTVAGMQGITSQLLNMTPALHVSEASTDQGNMNSTHLQKKTPQHRPFWHKAVLPADRKMRTRRV